MTYWTLDVVILRQELLVFLPQQFSATPHPDIYGTLTRMLGVHWYAQAVLQVLIVSLQSENSFKITAC